MLSTTAQLILANPSATLAKFLGHLAGHHVTVMRPDTDCAVISAGEAQAKMRWGASDLGIVVEAPDLTGLIEMKRMIAGHLVEFASGGQLDGLNWQGDGAGPSLPPDFRVMTVTSSEQISRHMRRIWFRGADLGRFDRLDALHVRLFFPPADLKEPVWPMIGADGLLQAIDPHLRPAIRKYTVRQIDVATGMVAIDFVMHDDAGPGSSFASSAAIGDRIGMAGPGGRGLVEARHYIFMADETGLPAVARMLENLPLQSRGQAFIEVDGARDEISLKKLAHVDVRWLHRSVGLSLQSALANLRLPHEPVYLWVAAEHAAFKDIRAAARQRLREGDQQLIVSYWRKGSSEDQHAASKRLETKDLKRATAL